MGLIDGCAGNSKFEVTYEDNGINVSAEVATGTYESYEIFPGGWWDDFYIEIKVKGAADEGDVKKCSLHLDSVNGDDEDMVQARVTVKRG